MDGGRAFRALVRSGIFDEVVAPERPRFTVTLVDAGGLPLHYRAS